VTGDEVQQLLDDVFDQALIHHGFTDHMRDYELVVHCTADPRTGIGPRSLRYLFETCVHATAATAVSEEVWARSLDDRLIDHRTGVDLDGYVWGVKRQVLYPGTRLVPDSERAEHWSNALGLDFHEVRIGTNGHDLTLVFSDLEVAEVAEVDEVDEVDEGYRPFTVGPSGPDLELPGARLDGRWVYVAADHS
jgi:hypothetical protein